MPRSAHDVEPVGQGPVDRVASEVSALPGHRKLVELDPLVRLRGV